MTYFFSLRFRALQPSGWGKAVVVQCAARKRKKIITQVVARTAPGLPITGLCSIPLALAILHGLLNRDESYSDSRPQAMM